MNYYQKLVDSFAQATNSPFAYLGIFDKKGFVDEVSAAAARAPQAPRYSPNQLIFPIASITKSFGAAAILKLRDAGRVSLDRPFWEYIDDKIMPTCLANGQEITLRHLLTHTSGLPTDDPWGDRQLKARDEDLLALLQNGLSFDIPAGDRYCYSNLGYMILGLIIRKVTGMSAQDYISHSILKPLGLTRTTWDPTAFDGVATGYRYSAFGVWEKEPYLVGKNSGAIFGGLYSCASDLATWARFMLQPWHGPNPTWANILALESIGELQELRALICADTCERDVGYEDVPDGRAYGYGLRIFGRANYNSIGHSGGIPGIGCHLRWIPRLGIGAVAFANRTYAPAWSLVRVALDEASEVHLSATLPADARHYLESIANKFLAYVWVNDRKSEADLFAENVFLDKTREEWVLEFADLMSAEGKSPNIISIRTPSALRVNIHLSSLRKLELNLTPTRPALIQSIKIIKS